MADDTNLPTKSVFASKAFWASIAAFIIGAAKVLGVSDAILGPITDNVDVVLGAATALAGAAGAIFTALRKTQLKL